MPRVTRIRTGFRRAPAGSFCATERDVRTAVDPLAASDACYRTHVFVLRTNPVPAIVLGLLNAAVVYLRCDELAALLHRIKGWAPPSDRSVGSAAV